eukprot:CAMPEP_0206611288 /NCGR_PEP_ID=MMETSP0325_2-20121206/55153_1 /ASSEMBLY_ACC=CAM_ASM_000347 /TAXON_ID=2866 /ORGANISM="Crypthecodinium cohnii, Strain Seligo" /LENGTH=79 /DNA_ID=CAMNT_0054130457 /DNA_START=104 /DNA_END=343 /DNA_ORIENTATION=-
MTAPRSRLGVGSLLPNADAPTSWGQDDEDDEGEGVGLKEMCSAVGLGATALAASAAPAPLAAPALGTTETARRPNFAVS